MSGKPLGIGIALSGGVPCFRVTPINRTVDEIWDAVRGAIDAGMSPEEFRSESRQAWAHHLEQDKKEAVKSL